MNKSKRRNGSKVRDDSQLVADVTPLSHTTGRKELFWIHGKPRELDVYRVHTKYLFFNIENGRYADKMLQLRAEHPGANIDPRQKKWREAILEMLKGEHAGTEADQEPFQKLRRDIEARQQLRPGVVLQDGGVLDGNRRLAVLLDLQSAKPNHERYAWFDTVVLPANTSAQDRWRIEAGLQLGRDEQLDYSPINRLLKIREGLRLFKGENLPPGKRPEQVVADTLFGVTAGVIDENIRRIRLIDDYLAFIGRPGAYHEIGDRMERFVEAVNILDLARQKQWPPEQMQSLTVALFAHIRDRSMSNWQLRDVMTAMGRRRCPTNERAMNAFLSAGADPANVQKALSETGERSSIAKATDQKAQNFLELIQAAKDMDQPVRLAERAKTNLETLLGTLRDQQVVKHDGWKEKLATLPALLTEITSLTSQCQQATSSLASAPARRGRRAP